MFSGMALISVLFLTAAAIVILTMAFAPSLEDKLKIWKEKKEEVVAQELDKLFYYDKSPKSIVRFYFILPPIFAGIFFLLSGSPLIAIAGLFLGLVIPNLILKIRNGRRRKKFNVQILDAIMILSSSLKGGLSLLQSLEVLIEEMPAPMSQEIGLVVRENKMGITLEESLRRLDKRMMMEDLSMVVNSILVARETGGDLTKVFSRLVTTIRDNRKLKENIKTLTLQGRLQGIIMSVLPILFVMWVLKFNPHHFDAMMQNEQGRFMLIIAGGLQIVGMILIHKFSQIKV
ncbi:MAG: type II secretion system F family protein [Candidatus Omnitrophica bacterium]|jgi:tight adherence protein B|nr:type II secretion system F family protein [Candidatus Omnitrophota bacterium]